jgi:hypothetical protein
VPILAGLILTLIFLSLGVYRRWRARDELDSAYLSKLAWVSVGLGSGTGAVALPALWVLVSYSIYGGSIESNLPPGASTGVLLGLLVVGALFTVVYAFVGYRDHVFPYRIVEGSLRGSDLDARPLQRGPEDLPE